MLGVPTGAAIRGIIFGAVGGVADIALSTTQIFVKEIGQPPPPVKRSPIKATGGLLSPVRKNITAWGIATSSNSRQYGLVSQALGGV